jgi:AcrR family transcriptional regulator
MGRHKLDSSVDALILDEVMYQTAEKGTNLVSTKDIAAKLKISEPVIFDRYKTKKELMDATFERAWAAFSAEPSYLVVLRADKSFLYKDYERLIKRRLTLKKEIIYIKHYKTSTFCNLELSTQLGAPLYDGMKSLVRQNYPEISDETLLFLVRTFLESEIDALYDFVTGYLEPTDENLSLAFTTIVEGFRAGINSVSEDS